MNQQKKENLDQYHRAYGPDFKFYDENQWYLSHYAKRLSKVIEEKPISSMLSLGIGHQAVINKILEHLGNGLNRYQILEGSKSIIQEFRSRQGDQDSLEITNTFFEEYSSAEKFDAIEMGFILEHVDDPEFIVQKYQGFLNPEGVLFIAVPNARSLHRLIGHKAGLLEDIYQLSEQDYELGHKRYFDLESISKLVTKSGLRITHKQGLMLKPITGSQLQTLGWGQNIIDALMLIGDSYPEIANCILIEAAR